MQTSQLLLCLLFCALAFSSCEGTCITPEHSKGHDIYGDASACLVPPGQKISDKFSLGCARKSYSKLLTTLSQPFEYDDPPRCAENRDACILSLQALDCSISCARCYELSTPGEGVGTWMSEHGENTIGSAGILPVEWPAEAAFPCRSLFDAVLEQCCPSVCPEWFDELRVQGAKLTDLLSVYDRIGERPECTAIVSNPIYTSRIGENRPFESLVLHPVNWDIEAGEKQDLDFDVIKFTNNYKLAKRTNKKVLPLILRKDNKFRAVFEYNVPNFVHLDYIDHLAVRVEMRSLGVQFQEWEFSIFNPQTNGFTVLGTQKSTSKMCAVTVGGPPADLECKWDIFTLDVPVLPSKFISTDSNPRQIKLRIRTGFGDGNPENSAAELDYMIVDLIPNKKVSYSIV
eukprot:TRINITY_DN1624_c0_g1_i1.p1 TRINITY_DN1624_c0_g1~~TRINITY_DN1624_c0_g1_i1.p1  ORF type:complete len:401 (+),score=41.46 TRINITY_DN1624_c0_g1_i1:24-1226(+)